MREGLCSKESDIIGCHQLQGLAFQRHFVAGGKHLAKEARDKVLQESHRPENKPLHIGVLALFDEVTLDVVLLDEVRDVGWSVFRCIAPSINRAIHEKPNLLLQRFINKGFPLFLLIFTGTNGNLNLVSQCGAIDRAIQRYLPGHCRLPRWGIQSLCVHFEREQRDHPNCPPPI